MGSGVMGATGDIPVVLTCKATRSLNFGSCRVCSGYRAAPIFDRSSLALDIVHLTGATQVIQTIN
jgi:hypothetical protein